MQQRALSPQSTYTYTHTYTHEPAHHRHDAIVSQLEATRADLRATLTEREMRREYVHFVRTRLRALSLYLSASRWPPRRSALSLSLSVYMCVTKKVESARVCCLLRHPQLLPSLSTKQPTYLPTYLPIYLFLCCIGARSPTHRARARAREIDTHARAAGKVSLATTGGHVRGGSFRLTLSLFNQSYT